MLRSYKLTEASWGMAADLSRGLLILSFMGKLQQVVEVHLRQGFAIEEKKMMH